MLQEVLPQVLGPSHKTAIDAREVKYEMSFLPTQCQDYKKQY